EAERLGVSVEFLSTISVVTGGNVENLEKGFLHLAAMLGKVSAGNQEAVDAFTRLGFNAEELAGMGIEGAFGQIADKIAGMTNTGQRAEAMMTLLTHRGLALAPALLQGAAGLKVLEQRAKDAGIFLTSIEAAGVLRAAMAMKQIDLTAKGLQRQLA